MEKYEEIIERSYRAFESKNLNELDKLVHTDAVIHTPDLNIPENMQGLEYFKEQMRIYTRAFPDISIKVREIFVKGDKAIAYVTAKGRHTGELKELSPTNKQITLDMVEMFKFRNDKISEYWTIYDNLSFMMQLGLITQDDLERKLVH